MPIHAYGLAATANVDPAKACSGSGPVGREWRQRARPGRSEADTASNQAKVAEWRWAEVSRADTPARYPVRTGPTRDAGNGR